MAWQSSGATNDELALALRRNGIIKSDVVLAAFQAVDRAHFVPPSMIDRAYNDYPIRIGSMHISAPHIYAQVLEGMDLFRGLSFLNIGSGTGYFSCLVGTIIGKDAINHGLEINAAAVAACNQACAAYSAQRMAQQDNSSDEEVAVQNDNNASHHLAEVPHDASDGDFSVCQAVHGSVFTMDCAANIKYDRIYVGAGAPTSLITTVHSLLKPLGIAIGPFGDKLVKLRCREDGSFTQTVLTGVHFAPLRDDSGNNDTKTCYFPPQVWTPALHATYPRPFRSAIKTLWQSQPRLPSVLWLRIFGMLPESWFNPERTTEQKMRFLLERALLFQPGLIDAVVLVETSAREDAEARATKAEAECQQLRMLAWRQENQIDSLISQAMEQWGAGTEDDLVAVDETPLSSENENMSSEDEELSEEENEAMPSDGEPL
ncbi:hypothetical protein ACHHYP_07402 [Achlya hypogyna]|uniref:Protein-L-isoaspartate O-methyltransferase n=1 Tax=Achlya hypogyna TaxID=1202772 RepID=A0A1V9ZM67_ACHHY|nr:hypothetical protein ACHHYP_07402 [Achlya hypogyna]